VVGVQNFDVGRNVNHATCDGTTAGSPQHHALGAFSVHAQRQLLDVQDDVDDVFANAFDRGEFVNHAVDLDGGHGRALQRGQEDAPQRVTERHAETAFQRLCNKTHLARGIPQGFDLWLLGTNKLLPVSFDHCVPQDRKGRLRSTRERARGGVKRKIVYA